MYTILLLFYTKVIRDLDSAKEKMSTLSKTYRLCCVPGCSVHYRQAATGSDWPILLSAPLSRVWTLAELTCPPLSSESVVTRPEEAQRPVRMLCSTEATRGNHHAGNSIITSGNRMLCTIVATATLLSVITQVGGVPLDVEGGSKPFIIVAQSGDPFNDDHDINIPEPSIVESGNL